MLGSALDADWMRVNAARAAANVAFSFVSCSSFTSIYFLDWSLEQGIERGKKNVASRAGYTRVATASASTATTSSRRSVESRAGYTRVYEETRWWQPPHA